MKLRSSIGRSALWRYGRAASPASKCGLLAWLALLVSGCFEPREQRLGYLGNGGAASANVATTSLQQPETATGPHVDAPDDYDDEDTLDGVRPAPSADAGPDAAVSVCVPAVVSTSQMRVLTRRQYDRTVRDLLGVTQLTRHDNAAPSSLLAPDANGELTELQWNAYRTAAEAIATQVMADSELRPRYLECDLAQRDSCLRATIVNFGRRAFRRPLSNDEVESFAPLLTQGAALEAEAVAQVLLETFLMSPSFLVRAELSQDQVAAGVFSLTSHEVAARLSYLLWGSMPDPVLDALADNGRLATNAQIRAEAQRMLGDDKARDMINDFVESYIGLEPGGRFALAKSEALFPEYTDAVRAAMSAEIQLFFQHVILGGGSFADLVSSQTAFVNVDTAPLYGLNSLDFDQTLTQVELPHRPGFLSRIGFLSAYSGATNTSPIQRGTFIARMLGFAARGSEPGLSTPLPGPEQADTMRKRVELQTANDACLACHTIINPPGFVLETFDAIGRVQTHERDTGAAIDTEVEWTINDETHVISTPLKLMDVIAQSNEARLTYARRWVAFALELDDVEREHCDAVVMSEALARDGYTQLDLLADLTQMSQFLQSFRAEP